MRDPNDDLIDEQLRQAFAPPPAEHYREVAQGISRPVRPWWPWLTLAAAAMLLVAFLWDGRGDVGGPGRPGGAKLGAMWVAAYDHAIDSGFGVGGCCEAPLDLSAKCREVCGAALSFGGNDDLQLLGCYCGGKPTGGCLGLLLQVDGDPVAVFVAPLDADPRPVLAERSELNLRRRVIGSVVLYSLAYAERDVLHGFSL